MARSLFGVQRKFIGAGAVPTHIAVIMDGNGRWAKSRGLPRVMGHRKGSESLRKVMEGCRELGIHCLTVYAFSAENWKRPTTEISDLMDLLKHYLDKEIASLHKEGVRLSIIGDRTQLSEDIQQKIQAAEEQTTANTAFQLNVALSYGSRQEIAQAARILAEKVKKGVLEPDHITPEILESELYTSALPEPDLLIRTGGEKRLSNFLLWQSAYTELYFTDVLWPDFTAEHLQEAVLEYANRERRYGTTS